MAQRTSLSRKRRTVAMDPGEFDTRNVGWYPANSSNYVAANRPNSEPIDTIILHVTQGSFAGTVSWFSDPKSGVSTHYIIRSSDGFIAQSVRENDIARHAGNWTYNQTSIGIEHEGYVEKPTSFTEAMYRSSAKLVAYLARKYSIPVDRQHIIGHDEVPDPNKPGRYGGASGHQDPGSYWDWNKYIGLINLYLPSV